jgi:hypothetical protein
MSNAALIALRFAVLPQESRSVKGGRAQKVFAHLPPLLYSLKRMVAAGTKSKLIDAFAADLVARPLSR